MLVFVSVAEQGQTSGLDTDQFEGRKADCVSDLSRPTAGERSVSAPGHQSGFVNFLHTASQLLLLLLPRTPPPCVEGWGVEMDYERKKEREWTL